MKLIPYRSGHRVVIWPLGLLPLLLAFAAYRTSSRHVSSLQATLATDDFIRDLDELFSTLQDAETGQRGYLLTGDLRYLTPFEDAKSSLPSQLSRVDTRAVHSSISQTDILKLHTLIDGKMSELQETVDLRERAGLAASLAIVQTARGQMYMSQIRTLIDTFKTEEAATFENRLQQLQRDRLLLEITLAIGVALSFLLVFFAYRFNSLYIQKRDSTEAEIRRLNEDLEVRVKDRTVDLEARTKELERRSIELQRSNADLQQFAYAASHDLQEPLRMIGSYIGLLARRYKGQLDEVADKYIDFAVSGARRMQDLINDLLAYSVAGTEAISKRPTSSRAIVERALGNLAVAIQESSAVVKRGDLPIVEADETKLMQVMQNLIGNAIKFRKPGAPPEIWITANRHDAEWVFVVRDNGIGFEPKYSDRIFQMFQRLHSVGKYPGNGIGLAICRRIIEHHGGRLWAESEPGVGSIFFFTLPLRGETARPKSDPINSEGRADRPHAAHV